MPIPEGKYSILIAIGTNRIAIIFPYVGVGYSAVQNSEEFTKKLSRQRAMNESVVHKESIQPSSNEPVPPRDKFSSGEELTEVSAKGGRCENLSKKEQAEATVHNEVCVC